MKLKLTLVDVARCVGCGAIGWTEEKTALCLSCCDIHLKVWTRKQRLIETLASKGAFVLKAKFVPVLKRIQEQLRQMGQSPRAGSTS
jgi:hypothetical protein